MRKKAKKLKHKIKYCVIHYHDRFDRYFVKKEWKDAKFIPFSKTARTDPFDDFDYSHLSQKCIKKYIKKWLHKKLNISADKVFGDYIKLGWRSVYEANLIWNEIVKKKEDIRYYHYWWGFYIDSDKIIRYKQRGLPN